MSASAPPPERDPYDPRTALAASGPLREFNRAGVLSAADVHVARRLGELGGETDDVVLLAVALAVRAPRIGHVLVDLASIRDTVAVDSEDAVDPGTLSWPDPAEWVRALAASPLVALESAPDEIRPLRLRDSWLYLDRYWTEEIAVADALRTMLAETVPGVDEATLADGLRRLFPGEEATGRQAAAAAAAVRRRLAVVAGGPGTGKTTTVARIAALLAETTVSAGDRGRGGERGHRGDAGEPGGDRAGRRARAPLVALAAPTGKAAARLQEAVHDSADDLDVAPAVRDALRGLRASTIHRLLGWRPDSNSRFRHDARHRLPHDVVVVDETSMVSLSLMARLIEALRSDARLVLVGDPGQRASLDAGAVLGDIVGAADGSAPVDRRDPGDESGPRDPVDRRDPGHADGPRDPAPGIGEESIVVLVRGHRFGGGIAELAAAIRGGDPDAVMELLRAGREDVTWIDVDPTGPRAAARVREEALPAALGVWEAARAGDGPGALEALGQFRILCAHRRGASGVATWTGRAEGWLAESARAFSSGERWYVGRPLLVTENDYELGLNNGDTGVVVQTGAGRVMASFQRSGVATLVSPSRLGAIDTVYAMTIHKSQGSQFAVAAVVLPEPGSRILTRELLYTAATRAQRRLILVGPEETIRLAVERPVARASGLAARLWE